MISHVGYLTLCTVRRLNEDARGLRAQNHRNPGIPFGDHPLKLERYREDLYGPRARMTRTHREVKATKFQNYGLSTASKTVANSDVQPFLQWMYLYDDDIHTSSNSRTSLDTCSSDAYLYIVV